MVGPPEDAPGRYRLGAPDQDRQQTVIRPDEIFAIRLDDYRRAVAADTGVDHADKDAARRKGPGQRGQKIGRGPSVEHGGIMHQIDHGDAWRALRQNGLHFADIGAGQAKIGKQQDHDA